MCLYRGENYSKKVGKLTKVIILVLWLYRGWLYGGLTVYDKLLVSYQNSNLLPNYKFTTIFNNSKPC